MPLHKSTQFLSEIATFFKQNDATRAFSALARLLCTLRMSDKTLFSTTTKPNAKHSLCEILQTLLLFPCCAIRNPYRYDSSPLFEAVASESIELTLSERIWGALRGAVAALAETFGLTDEEVFEGLSANVSFDINMLLAYNSKVA